ncbi:M60 family metallopeptidase [Clostridium sp. AL.422]|uniref:M60 family metallopeptidase n=1 Tax=Clostridium TaxID=1485 RepID=UPI00293DAE4F|nr:MULTISPECIES: M60 family metallopeptidase [unclassified Clostridium]MDV4151299.1 M60 family metallopeptidase [Clostridium sp. AL.422]
MNRRKISAMLAVALITSQTQTITFAETVTNNAKLEIVNEVNINNIDESNLDIASDEIKDDENIEELDIEITEESNDIINNEEVNKLDNEKQNQVQSKIVGKLELDMNFSTPIKVADADKTNISIKLIKDGENYTINLGSDINKGNIEGTDIAYSLEALDYTRAQLSESATDIDFYHLTFENLDLGTYSLEISGAGYQTLSIPKIEIQNVSKRILLGTSDKTIVLNDNGTEDKADDIIEEYVGMFLSGDVNDDGAVNKADYDEMKSKITSKSTEERYDLNRDGKIDITDLAYVHSNIDKVQKGAVIIDTDIIINPASVNVLAMDGTLVEDGANIKDILEDNNKSVSLKNDKDIEISEENPVSVNIDLTGNSSVANKVEQIVIKAPSENAPTSGSVVIGDEVFEFNESNIVTASAYARTSEETIVINLGKQVAVSEVKINITGSRGNKNLTEIAKVEFLNNVYTEIPKPKMNIPVINSFTSTTQVGQESMTIGWDHENNVTGYEVKVENLSNNSVNTYKTGENSLRIEKVEGYGIYRISIQSLSGEWKSGYKDEQEGYSIAEIGDTNLTNNSNDKDGIPDNVDLNYNPQAWDSNTGKLSESATGENGNSFGKDSIIEVQVIPETAPEGPEGITVKGGYKQLTVSWKSHKKAKDYDLYYREAGTKAWIKANDPDSSYVDSEDDDIPSRVSDLKPEEKTDSNELIRATSYTISGLKDTTSYEIMMTATNHHGTGGLSKVYIGTTTKLIAPVTTNYNLINSANDITNHIEKVEYTGTIDQNYTLDDQLAVIDNDYTTAWTWNSWDTSAYGKNGPIVTFDEEYTIDTIKVITRLDIESQPYRGNIGFINEETGQWEYRDISVSLTGNNKVATLKLSEPIKAKTIQPNISVYPSVGTGTVSISEIKFYKYDSLQKDVDALFADDLKLSLNDDVTYEMVSELTNRAKTIDPINLEYHENQTEILNDLKRAEDLLNDVTLNDKIITLDSSIHNLAPQNTIGQSNNYQSLGVAVKPGDKVNIYIGSTRKNTKFELALTQFNAESGTAYKVIQELSVGKNEVEIPETGFDMNYEKGGNLFISLKSQFSDSNEFKVRVSGGTAIPHLNVNNIIDDESKENEAKEAIRTYIRELKSYVNSLPNRYPESASIIDNTNNIYTYDPQTSILNSTEIEGERITLSLAADQVLSGIESGLSGNEDAEVDRLYNSLLAWEQIMKVSYAQQGLLEEAIDFDNDGKITNTALDILNGKSETQYYNENRAPKNRMNIKYQRMFTGAFMYASSHHVGIGYGSIAGCMSGVPFKFDSTGNLVNSEDGQLFGWGIAHEIGHVHDIKGLTYEETTNNILALITQTFNDISESRIESSDAYVKVYDKVTSNSVGLASDILTRLSMFWQLHLAYDNDYTYKMLDINTDNNIENDTFYAKLYRATRINGVAPSEAGYDSTAQTFIMRASDAAGKDLRDFFEKWGLVASPKTNEYLNSKNYPKETRAIYYLNDEARRLILKAGDDTSSLTMSSDTKANGSFGSDESGNIISDRSYLNNKEVPFTFSVTNDSDKILGYEIIRKEATSTGTQEVSVGFVERDKTGENGLTNYTDVIDVLNNRTFEYKVRAYDYNLNVTEEATIGTVKVNHDGSISKSNWVFDTNTRSSEDSCDEHSGHGQVQDGNIQKINDNDASTIYTASKTTDKNGNTVSGDPYVTIDLGDSKSVVGLKYNPGQSTTKKFSLKNFFKRSSEIAHSPIANYEVLVSKDGKTWTKAHSGKFDTSKENTIHFNEAGSNLNTQLWAYDAQYVKLVAKGASAISIAELDILAKAGDNIEIGVDNGDKIYQNGIGRLKSDYSYADGKTIPKGSIIINGEYKGDPAFNVPLVLNENDENFSLEANVILLAELPENAELGEVAEGNWIYWITPDAQKDGNIEGSKVKAELYRYNKLDSTGAPVGQRLVSDTFLYDLPEDLNNLPEIELNSSKERTIADDNNTVIEINNELMKKVFENKN